MKLSHYTYSYQKRSGYLKNYGQTKWMYFLIEDDDFLEKYTSICHKITPDIKKEFDSKPVYNYKNFKHQNKILR